MSWSDVGGIRTPAARKRHNCTWCGQVIHVGERYLTRSGICEGDFSVIKHHLECDEAANEYASAYPGECWEAYSNERPDMRLPAIMLSESDAGVSG